MIKKICSFLATLLMLGLLAVAGLLFIPRAMGYDEFAVLSGSMKPKLQVGSLVYTKEVKESNFKKGDIVTFKLAKDTIVTHRIEEINSDGTYTTKGDANNTVDGATITKENIVGKYSFNIPYLGYVSIYSKTPIGVAVLCGLIVIVLLLNFLPDALSEKEVYNDDWPNEE